MLDKSNFKELEDRAHHGGEAAAHTPQSGSRERSAGTQLASSFLLQLWLTLPAPPQQGDALKVGEPSHLNKLNLELLTAVPRGQFPWWF